MTLSLNKCLMRGMILQLNRMQLRCSSFQLLSMLIACCVNLHAIMIVTKTIVFVRRKAQAIFSYDYHKLNISNVLHLKKSSLCICYLFPGNPRPSER